MNPKEYVKKVLITEARDFTPVRERLREEKNIRLVHASAGITSEVAEILELADASRGLNEINRAHIREEMGDILWYVGIASDALNASERIMGPVIHTAKKLESDDDLAESLMALGTAMATLSGEFADLAIKKFCFYGKPFDAEPLIQILARINGFVDIALTEAGYTIEDAREKNIAKLAARYGEKFSEAAALERNLDKENEILEKK